VSGTLRSLQELKALKKALADKAIEQARQQAEAQERLARERREQALFALTVGPVAPLRHAARAPIPRPRPSPVPRQRELVEALVLREAISDEFDVETLLDTDDALSFRRPGIGPEVVRKLRRGVWAIQAQLDLHGMVASEARLRVAEFLHHCKKHGLRCVRIIHGKGLGSRNREPVLKNRLRNWLMQRDEVIAYCQARKVDGGSGAVVVLLKAG
jgi:DNA-nicking Smr family endonuclease